MGFNNAKWSIVIKVAEELGIKPPNYKKMNGHLKKRSSWLDQEAKKYKSHLAGSFIKLRKKKKDNVIKNLFCLI